MLKNTDYIVRNDRFSGSIKRWESTTAALVHTIYPLSNGHVKAHNKILKTFKIYLVIKKFILRDYYKLYILQVV